MHSKMKLTSAIVYILSAFSNLAVVNSQNHLSAVSSSAGLGEFYLEMKRLHSITQVPKEENTQAICDAVLNSAHFLYHHEVRPIGLWDEWVQNELTTHADLYPELFQNVTVSKVNPSYIVAHVSYVDEYINEFVFPCAAKKRRSKTLEIYFISYKYDFGCMIEDKYRDGSRDEGRFVFMYNKTVGRVNIVALAESPVAVYHFGPDAYNLKYETPSSFLAEVQQCNELCDHWTPLDKVRLCSVALNGNAYKGVVKFLSRDVDVQARCENVQIELFFERSEYDLSNSHRSGNVTVFKCFANRIGFETSPSVTFFISASEKRYQFFIFSEVGNRKIIQKYFRSHNLGCIYQTVLDS